MFIPVHNLFEQKPAAKSNETTADAFVCRAVFSGVSNICPIYTGYSTWLSLPGTKRDSSRVGIAVREKSLQHYVYKCIAGGYIYKFRILRVEIP
jgi:hypothetical protein